MSLACEKKKYSFKTRFFLTNPNPYTARRAPPQPELTIAISSNPYTDSSSRIASRAHGGSSSTCCVRAQEKKNDTIFTTYGSGSSWSPSRDRYTNASVPKPSMDMSVRSPPKYRA